MKLNLRRIVARLMGQKFFVGDRVVTHDPGYILAYDQRRGEIVKQYSRKLFNVKLDNYCDALSFFDHEMTHEIIKESGIDNEEVKP